MCPEPEFGSRTIARHIIRAGVVISRSSVRCIQQEERGERPAPTQPIEDGFTQRHLQDTRYINALACDYLGLLYGGRVSDQGSADSIRRIVTPSGGLTAWLRRGWGLNAVLSDRDEKERHDHRHHAIDAIVIACADQSAIKRIADAAQRMESLHQERAFDQVKAPWDDFVPDVRDGIADIAVSYRLDRRVRGPLHKESLYSKPYPETDGSHRVRIRTELSAVTKNDLEKGRIVDARAEAAIRNKLEELGESDPAKAFKDPKNLPTVRGHDGKTLVLRRVRVIDRARPETIGRHPRERRVVNARNHHTVVYRADSPSGERWGHRVVSLLDAARAVAAGRSASEDVLPADATVLFTLSRGEHVEMIDPKAEHERHIYRVLSISDREIKVIRTHDGRTSAVSGKDRTRVTGSGDKLRTLEARKVRVTHLGEVVDAGG